MKKLVSVIKYIIESTASLAIESKPKTDFKSVLIFGTPRSGTTWLLDLIARIPNSKSIFEPLNPNWFPELKKLNLLPRPYLSPTSSFPELSSYLERTLIGISRSYNPPYSFLDIKRILNRFYFNTVIVKFVRANRLLPWILEQLGSNSNLEFRGVLIVRHPCATILSQLKTGWIGYPMLIEKIIRSDPARAIPLVRGIILRELYQIPELETNLFNKIMKMDTIEQLLAVEYSLDYLIPLRYLNKTKQHHMLVVTYEELVLNFESSIKKIFNHLEKNIPPNVLTAYKKPSKTTKESEKGYLGSRMQLEKWKVGLTNRQINNILEVLDLFNLDIYTENIEPNYGRFREV